MATIKRIALAVAALALGGCSFSTTAPTLNPNMLMDSYSIQDRRDGSFRINISPAKYKQLNEAGAHDLRAFINGAVLRKHLCPAGYTTGAPETHWGPVEISGRCNPAT